MSPTPKHAAAWTLLSSGAVERAVQQLRVALRRDPNDIDALGLLALALPRAGDFAGAEWAASRLVSLLPHDARPWHNLGNILLESGRAEDAMQPLLRARELAPDEPQTAIALSNACMSTNRWTMAQEACRALVEANPQESRLAGNLAIALHGAGRVEEAWPLALRARQIDPSRIEHADAIAAMSTYSPDLSWCDSLEYHREYGQAMARRTQPLTAPHRCNQDTTKATVGILSPDLRDHAVAKFARPLLEHRSKEQIRVVCYSVATKEDHVSQELRALADGWRHMPHDADQAIARRIQRDGIDLLLDLAGHTRGHRLGVFAMRPAPVQAAWMGYPNTTGLESVHYRIVDAIADPPPTQRQNIEQLAHIERCFVAFAPLPRKHEHPHQHAGAVRFASFSSLLKINHRLLRTWCDILRRVPGSTLTLKHHALADDGVREHMLARFARQGIDPVRVRLLEPSPTSAGVLPFYHEVDIALDTFPYAGTTTTCEALSMGVPVVTLAGETTASRVGRSLLTAAGVPELVANTAEEYAEVAVALATNTQRRRELRQRLRDGYATSVLADVSGFGARMSTLLVDLVRKHRHART